MEASEAEIAIAKQAFEQGDVSLEYRLGNVILAMKAKELPASIDGDGEQFGFPLTAEGIEETRQLCGLIDAETAEQFIRAMAKMWGCSPGFAAHHIKQDKRTEAAEARAATRVKELPLETVERVRIQIMAGLIEATDKYGYDLDGNDFAAAANIVIEHLQGGAAIASMGGLREARAALRAADKRLCELVGPTSEDEQTCAVVMQIRGAGARLSGIQPATEPCPKVEKWTHG